MKAPVFENLMFEEPSVWVTATTVVTLMSMLYLAFSEMIGNHLQYSKFTDTSYKPSSINKRRIKLSSRTGMLILYTPAFLAGLASFFVFPGGGIRLLLLKFSLTFHFFKRDFEVHFVHKYSGSMILGSAIIISMVYLSAVSGMIVVQHLSIGLSEPSIDLKYVGLIMFIIGILGNFYHHYLLSKIRKKGEKEYRIPVGGLFNRIVCPHYLFEIIIFVGFSFISQTPLSFACAFGDSLYLIARSYETRKWYLNKFEDFPKTIKCVIPYIF